MSRLSIIKFFTIPIFVLLFSLGIFSFKSNAQVATQLPAQLATNHLNAQGDLFFLDTNASNHFSGLFYYNYNNTSPYYYLTVIFDSNIISFSYSYLNQGTTYSNTVNGPLTKYTYNGSDYYYYVISSLDTSMTFLWTYNSSLYYSSLASVFHDLELSQGPESADFGLLDFRYSTRTSDVVGPLSEFYLDYDVYWSGSTNNDFPITRVDYKVYGYYDIGADVTAFDGVLINQGASSSPFHFLSSSLTTSQYNNVQKVVLYFTPYSNNTEGNTHYIVCDIFESDVTLDVFGFDIPVGRLLGYKKKYGNGVINVPYTSYVQDNDYYYPVAYVNDTPVTNVVETKTGYINVMNDNHSEVTNYNVVTYGDTVTNNNQVYNNQVYNYTFNQKQIDEDDTGYINSIIAFLTMVCTFFGTCWSYFVVALNWLPMWCIPIITGLTSLLGTIVIGLGILKLLKGVL